MDRLEIISGMLQAMWVNTVHIRPLVTDQVVGPTIHVVLVQKLLEIGTVVMTHLDGWVVQNLVAQSFNAPVIVHILATEQGLILWAYALNHLSLVRDVDPG